MYSLERLLVTVPKTFQANNANVEPHAYFAKWKAFDPRAFADHDEEEQRDIETRREEGHVLLESRELAI